MPTASAAPVARLATLAASNATPTPPTMLLIAAITLGQEPQRDQRAGHRPHVHGARPGHLTDVGAAGGLEHELLGGQGADERLLACLLLHADAPGSKGPAGGLAQTDQQLAGSG
jgi:hypothetical protein